MIRRRAGFRPAAEPLEERWTPTTVVLPANTLSARIAEIRARRGPEAVPTAVEPRDLTPGKSSTVIGLSAVPPPGSGVRPRIVGALGPDGRHVPFRAGAPSVTPIHPEALGYAAVGRPGTLSALVASRRGAGPAVVSDFLPGDVNGDGTVDFADARLYTSTYLARRGDSHYLPSADANRNGFIGQGDARFLLRNFPPQTPRIPLEVDLGLAPGQYEFGSTLNNSGGITRLPEVTVIGRTTPGSIVYADSGLGDYTFIGPARVADEDGFFSFDFQFNPENRLRSTQYLVIDPFGQQTIRAFPILFDR